MPGHLHFYDLNFGSFIKYADSDKSTIINLFIGNHDIINKIAEMDVHASGSNGRW